jgi:integrase
LNLTRAIINPNDVLWMTLALKRVHPRFCLLWQLGIITGLRISDLLSLTVLYVSTGSITIREKKTKKYRYFSLDPDIMSDIAHYTRLFKLKPEHFLFFSSSSKFNKPMSRQWANRIIARTAKIRGLRCIGAHSMRKIYACTLYQSTGDLKSVQRALGHRYPSTTLFYLRDLLPGSNTRTGA